MRWAALLAVHGIGSVHAVAELREDARDLHHLTGHYLALVEIGQDRFGAGTVRAHLISVRFLHGKRLPMATPDVLVPANVRKS